MLSTLFFYHICSVIIWKLTSWSWVSTCITHPHHVWVMWSHAWQIQLYHFTHTYNMTHITWHICENISHDSHIHVSHARTSQAQTCGWYAENCYKHKSLSVSQSPYLLRPSLPPPSLLPPLSLSHEERGTLTFLQYLAVCSMEALTTPHPPHCLHNPNHNVAWGKIYS